MAKSLTNKQIKDIEELVDVEFSRHRNDYDFNIWEFKAKKQTYVVYFAVEFTDIETFIHYTHEYNLNGYESPCAVPLSGMIKLGEILKEGK